MINCSTYNKLIVLRYVALLALQGNMYPNNLLFSSRFVFLISISVDSQRTRRVGKIVMSSVLEPKSLAVLTASGLSVYSLGFYEASLVLQVQSLALHCPLLALFSDTLSSSLINLPPHRRLAFFYQQVQSLSLSLLFSYTLYSLLLSALIITSRLCYRNTSVPWTHFTSTFSTPGNNSSVSYYNHHLVTQFIEFILAVTLLYLGGCSDSRQTAIIHHCSIWVTYE